MSVVQRESGWEGGGADKGGVETELGGSGRGGVREQASMSCEPRFYGELARPLGAAAVREEERLSCKTHAQGPGG